MTKQVTVKIRRAQPDDQQVIIEIFNEAVLAGIATDESKPVTVDQRQDWFAQFDERHPLWVATIDGTVVGWCALENFYPNHAYRDSAEIAIYIHKRAHRHGIGRLFLNYVGQQIKNHLHFKTVIAYIYERNQPSQGLFSSCGYEKWGHMPNISKVDGEYRELKIYGKNFPTA